MPSSSSSPVAEELARSRARGSSSAPGRRGRASGASSRSGSSTGRPGRRTGSSGSIVGSSTSGRWKTGSTPPSSLERQFLDQRAVRRRLSRARSPSSAGSAGSGSPGRRRRPSGRCRGRCTTGRNVGSTLNSSDSSLVTGSVTDVGQDVGPPAERRASGPLVHEREQLRACGFEAARAAVPRPPGTFHIGRP